MITSQELVSRMMAEILRDMLTGRVPRNVASFSALHDYVDANCYGGTEELFESMPMDELFPLMNEAQTTVDNWLKGRVLEGV